MRNPAIRRCFWGSEGLSLLCSSADGVLSGRFFFLSLVSFFFIEVIVIACLVRNKLYD
jgi:hypothetical protein